MPMTRRASATWEGDLTSGAGRVSTDTSVLKDVNVTWKARSEEAGGLTSPEELLAAAHASCFSMALSSRLAKAGTPARKLQVTSAVTFDSGKVVSSVLEVNGDVPGASAQSFKDLAEDAKNNCPISVALKGNVEMSVTATLAG